jgi:hypothetical protein
MVGGAESVDRVLSSVAAAAGARLLEITHEIWRLLTDDIPQLQGDDVVEKLLAASVERTLPRSSTCSSTPHCLTGRRLLRRQYARRLAQRDMPIEALVRAYRIGHGRFWRVASKRRPRDQTMPGSPPRSQTGWWGELPLIDRVSEQVVEVYQRERDRWLLTRTAMRAARVRALLSDQTVDVTATESALGYRLGQYHLGTVAWVTGKVDGSDGLTRIERLLSTASRTLGNRGRALFVPRDIALVWSWLPLGVERESALS